MKRFDRVKEILEAAIHGAPIRAHGPFWRNLDLLSFKTKTVYGRPLIDPGHGATSNLVLALRGQAPFGADFGVPGATLPRMPVGFPAVSGDEIAFIEHWIEDGCPDEDADA